MSKRNSRARRLWLTLHLYLGLWLGGLFALIGVTGSILVFEDRIDAWLNPALVIRAEGTPLSLDQLVASVRQEKLDGAQPHSLWIPTTPDHAWSVLVEVPQPPGESTWRELSLNPYTGAVVADRMSGEYFISFVLKLHYELLLGERGLTIVGLIGVGLLLSCLSGLYLWWPRGGKWRQAFTLKKGASPTRLNYDTHRAGGFYSSLVLIVVAFSGVYLTLPDYIVPIVKAFSPVTPLPKGVTSGPAAGPAISVTQAATAALAHYPDARLRGVMLPADARGAYRITVRQPGEIREDGRTRIWIDQYSGALLAVHDPRRFTAGDTFLMWQLPLHTGKALGLPGRWLVFVSGLVPLLLLVTGLLIWNRKRSGKIATAHRRADGMDDPVQRI